MKEADLATSSQVGMKLRRTSTSGQVVLKLIVAKLATIFDGSFTVNFWPSWPEVKWCPSWTPFPSEHGLSKRFPSWEPFLRSTSGQLDQKLIVTMMVHISRAGTSDQVDPKLEIRAKLARIICSGSKVKMCAKLAHIFHGKTDNRNSGQVVRNYRVNTDQLGRKLQKGGEARS